MDDDSACLAPLVAVALVPLTGALLMMLAWLLHGYVEAIPTLGYWRAVGITGCLTLMRACLM